MRSAVYIAVDDTDSRAGNCTSFLATELVRELSDLDLIGMPRLVRLNPAVPWKTRGNGSLTMQVGKGAGEATSIGEIGGQEIFCYQRSVQEPDIEEVLKRCADVVRKRSSPDAEPGLVVSRHKPSSRLYWRGVREILDRGMVDEHLAHVGARTFELRGGRGIVGAACAMAWRPRDHTYELLAYRQEGLWGSSRQVRRESIQDMDRVFPSTFNNWEEKKGKAAIVPSTPCPVLYGIRGDVAQDLPLAQASLQTEDPERWLIFLSNQGTDDHIIHDHRELIANQSYALSGTVSRSVGRLPGGHSFLYMESKYGEVCCALYEPSKEFRVLFDLLIPGDRIEVYGELREEPRSLNVEKVRVLDLVQNEVKTANPLCTQCGKRMHSVGSGQGYRCRLCGTRSWQAVTKMEPRSLRLGWYEPPVSARRHLSKPLQRMGLEQPVYFV